MYKKIELYKKYFIGKGNNRILPIISFFLQ